MSQVLRNQEADLCINTSEVTAQCNQDLLLTVKICIQIFSLCLILFVLFSKVARIKYFFIKPCF